MTYLLSVIEDEAREDSGSSVCTNGLKSGESAKGHARHDHRCETRADENTETGEEGTTLFEHQSQRLFMTVREEEDTHQPKILIALCGGADVRDSSDGTGGVEGRTSEDSGI